MKKLLLILLIFLSTVAGAQNFITTFGFFGYNEAVDVLEHTNGFIVIGNSSSGGGNTQSYLVKTGYDTVPYWDQSYFRGNVTRITAAHILSNDSIILAGTHLANAGNGYDFFVALVDTSGNVWWEKSFGSRAWEEITALDAGSNSIWLAGRSQEDTSNYYRAQFFKTDFSGNIILQDTITQYKETVINDISLTGDSLIAAAGYSLDTVSKGHLMLLDTAFHMHTDTILIDTLAGELLFCQWYNQRVIAGGYLTDSINQKQHWNIIFNPGTGKLRSSNGGGKNDDILTDVAITASGYMFFTGYTTSYGGGKKDVLLSVHDYNGNWKKSGTYGAGENEMGTGIIITDTNRMIICGTSSSWGPHFTNIFLIIADSGNTAISYDDLHFTDIAKKQGPVEKLSAFPNPFGSYITVDCPATVNNFPYRILIRDLSGRRIRSVSSSNSSIKIPTGDLKPGMYLLELEGTGLVQKIVKE